MSNPHFPHDAPPPEAVTKAPHPMEDWVFPSPLARLVPRKVRMTRQRMGLTVLLAAGLCVPFMLFADGILVPEYRMNKLDARGIDIVGTVVGLTPGYPSHARGYHGPWGEFIFVPKELSKLAGPAARVKLKISQRDYEALSVGKPVSLVYDPLDPENVETKRVMELRRYRTGRPYWVSGLILVLLIPGMLAALIMPFVLGPYFRERNLLKWGKAARVTIVRRIDLPVEKGTRVALNYSFQDENGMIRRGETDIFQEDGATAPLPSTVVYDPRRSDRSMLYPGSAAELNPRM
jgi:hypothetical protein